MAKRKSSSTKKVTKSTKKQVGSPLFVGFVTVIAILSVIVLGSWGINAVIDANNQARLDRIYAIYNSLELDTNEYQVEQADVFGEKRAYEWDKGRTYSSTIEYLHGDTVTNTFNDLDAKVREAGFEFVDEPYPDTVQKQYHYKSKQGEYLRLSVSSKQYEDAVRNATLMGDDIATVVDQFENGTDAGPAKVVIKVNLDDNNE